MTTQVALSTEHLPLLESPAPLGLAKSDERISSIDLLRGLALLGIALMNIVGSGLPLAASWNPKVAGGATGLNLAAYFAQHVLFDGTMRGLFSMMFGASTYLLVTRLEERGAGLRAAEIVLRRLLWLMLFGIAHAYLIWFGDILYDYALLGLVLLPLLRLPPRALLIAAGLMLLFITGDDVRKGFSLRLAHRLALEAAQAEALHKPLTDELKNARSAWEERRKYVSPTAADLKAEREQFSGSYFNVVSKRAVGVYHWHSRPFYWLTGWDMLTMMLVGIAFVKTGVLAAQRSVGFYWRMLAVCYAVCLPLGAVTQWLAWKRGFEPLDTVLIFSTYQAARIGMSLGHMSLAILIYKYGLFSGLSARLAAVGQTAFSNYIAHSLVYGFVFYGYGLNLFDKLQRYQLYYVVLGMWLFSLIASPIWLRHFRFGPLEWAWRSLTYWKRQPMRTPRKSVAVAA